MKQDKKKKCPCEKKDQACNECQYFINNGGHCEGCSLVHRGILREIQPEEIYEEMRVHQGALENEVA